MKIVLYSTDVKGLKQEMELDEDFITNHLSSLTSNVQGLIGLLKQDESKLSAWINGSGRVIRF